MPKKNRLILIPSLIFVCYLFLWFVIHIVVKTTDGVLNNAFADSYGILAGAGGIIALHIASKWEYLRSYVGKAIFYLSLGLLAQFLGQLSYTVLFYVYNIENAYPAFGEVFYLATIPLYIMGVWYIAKASGFTLNSKSYDKTASAVVIPAILLGISYYMFFRTYDATDLPFSIVFLDYIYPIGQALFVSLAIVTYYATKKTLGGVMRERVLFILFALFFQYIADSMFIYETRSEIWYAGGLSDMMFLISYFLMTVGLIQFDTDSISNEVKSYKTN